MSDLLAFYLVVILALPVHCIQSQSVESLKGQQYVDLPEGLCQGYSETFLGKVAGQEYVGLICEGKTRSYLLLERIVGYTNQGKAIMQALSIKQLPSLQTDEISVAQGCVEINHGSRAIFAIVKDSQSPFYQVVRAWEANLSREEFEERHPGSIICSNPWLESDDKSPQ